MISAIRVLPLVAAAAGCSGCGVLLQTAFGWHSEETQRRTEQHAVAVTSIPPGAEIMRKSPSGETTSIGTAPLTDRVSYQTDVTIESPRVGGLLVGGIIEATLGVGLIVAGTSSSNDIGSGVGLTLGGTYVLLLSAVPELLTALIFGLSGDTVKNRHSVAGTQDYTYSARLIGYPEAMGTIHAPDQGRTELVLDPNASSGRIAGTNPRSQATNPAPLPANPSSSSNPPAPAADRSWVIAVMDVEDLNAERREQAIDRGLVRNLGDQLRVFIAQQGVRTVDRGAQERIVKDQIAALKGESFKACYDDSCQIELGKALAASHILRSRITRFGQRCVLNTELIDLKAEVTMRASSAQGDCGAEGFLSMSEQVARKLLTAAR